MLRLFFWLFAIPLLAVILVFSTTNAALIEISVWPALDQPVLFPVYGVAIISLLIGFLIGGWVAFLGGGRSRQRSRDLLRQVETDRREMAILRKQVEKLEAEKKLPASGSTASLPAPSRQAA